MECEKIYSSISTKNHTIKRRGSWKGYGKINNVTLNGGTLHNEGWIDTLTYNSGVYRGYIGFNAYVGTINLDVNQNFDHDYAAQVVHLAVGIPLNVDVYDGGNFNTGIGYGYVMSYANATVSDGGVLSLTNDATITNATLNAGGTLYNDGSIGTLNYNGGEYSFGDYGYIGMLNLDITTPTFVNDILGVNDIFGLNNHRVGGLSVNVTGNGYFHNEDGRSIENATVSNGGWLVNGDSSLTYGYGGYSSETITNATVNNGGRLDNHAGIVDATVNGGWLDNNGWTASATVNGGWLDNKGYIWNVTMDGGNVRNSGSISSLTYDGGTYIGQGRVENLRLATPGVVDEVTVGYNATSVDGVTFNGVNSTANNGTITTANVNGATLYNGYGFNDGNYNVSVPRTASSEFALRIR